MPLKAVVETLDGLNDADKAHYTEKDGKHYLQVEAVDGFALEDVSGLKGTLSKELTLRKKLEKDVIKFKDIDPDKAREAIAKLDEMMSFDPTKEADKIIAERVEAARKQLLEKHADETSKKEGRIGALTKTVESLIRDNTATVAITEAGGSVKLLLGTIKDQTRVREDANGNWVVEVIDEAGNVRIGNAKGDPMTIAELVQELKQSADYGQAFKASDHKGSGTPPPGTRGGRPQVARRADLKTREQRMAFIHSFPSETEGQKAYLALPE